MAIRNDTDAVMILMIFECGCMRNWPVTEVNCFFQKSIGSFHHGMEIVPSRKYSRSSEKCLESSNKLSCLGSEFCFLVH